MPRPVSFEDATARALEGRSFKVFSSCSSTNDVAKEWALEGAPHLSAVTSDTQESGRGRVGRSWHAKAHAGLLCSIVLRPELDVSRWGIIPLLAGVALVRAIEDRTSVKTTLKWPNDVLFEDRKVAGILCEGQPGDFVICGIGVNVSGAPGKGIAATSLMKAGARRLDRPDLLAALLVQLEEVLKDPDAALDAWRKNSSTLKQKVRVTMLDGSVLEGVAESLDDSGGLTIRLPDHSKHVVLSGDVEHLRRPGTSY